MASVSYLKADVIPWGPKNTTSVDQSAVHNGTYYLSDRVNSAVHVVDLASAKIKTDVQGFGHNGISGPNGFYLIATSCTLAMVTVLIPTGSLHRADEFAYDAERQLITVTNPEETVPYVTIISAVSRQVLGNITFPTATNDGYTYVSVPETTTNAGGEIDVIDVEQFKIIKLLLGCSYNSIVAYGTAHTAIMDDTTGNTTAIIDGIAGADQVASDPTRNLFYVTAYQNTADGTKNGTPDPKLAIIDAGTYTLVDAIATDNVTAHSVAVDP
ncbi:hypothetical protein V1525DRAFT_422262 [Lipomyces kononenkoae]|uniref:Uncharacterized protein n=1 Tax=Lipomyces kononenkoae TaxID=34357 RepID=A0ACC3SS14_LIPKO